VLLGCRLFSRWLLTEFDIVDGSAGAAVRGG
jgi:hypothetical protein